MRQRACLIRHAPRAGDPPRTVEMQSLPLPPPFQLLVLACLAVGTLWPSPTRVAAAGSMPDIPPALAFGPQLAWPHRTRSHLVVGQTRMTLPGALRPYHASRWRGRRAASLRPLPEDAETGASPATSHYHYVIQDRDAGCFLSACVQLRVTRDLVSEYCRPFIGPVLYDEVPPRGRGRLRPALDGHRWRE